jgi:hypothetical protein
MAQKLELLEVNYGLTDEIIEERRILKEKYPGYFKEYMQAKEKKEEIRRLKEKADKEIQMRERGCETVSFYKKKMEEQKRKNRLKND